MENPQKEVVQVQKEDLLAKAMNRINARAQSTLTNHAGGAMGVSDGESDWVSFIPLMYLSAPD